MAILVIDIGTTSMRGIIYDERGQQLAIHQVLNHPVFHENGWVTEAPSDWSDNLYDIVSNLMKTEYADKVNAISVTSQRSSIMPVDANGTPLMDTIMWQDTRNQEICKEFEKFNSKIFRLTGSRVNTVFSGSKMTWIRQNCPEVYAKTEKFLNIPEYVMFLMTGGYNSDYTYASRSGLMNLYSKEWDEELLLLYNVDKNKLCQLHEPGTIVGYTTERFRELTECPEGISVITAGGDQQCAAIGQGVFASGDVSLVAGTGGFMLAACDKVPENLIDNVICNCSSDAGHYIIESNVLACSAAFDWFAHNIYGMDAIDYAFTEEELKREMMPTDCLVVPYLKGRGAPDWNSNAKAVFANVTLATRRSEMFKSLMESVFMELENHLENFSDYVKIRNIYISGGVTKSTTLDQLMADILGRPLTCRADAESTARGAFLVAAVTYGLASSLTDAFAMIQPDTGNIYTPDMKTFLCYDDKRKKMNEVYRLLYT